MILQKGKMMPEFDLLVTTVTTTKHARIFASCEEEAVEEGTLGMQADRVERAILGRAPLQKPGVQSSPHSRRLSMPAKLF